jgi:predicted AAA+ superfamily ATPase
MLERAIGPRLEEARCESPAVALLGPRQSGKTALALSVAAGRPVGRYLDLLVGLLLVRRLPPWHTNVGTRLVKSPKVYVRDSGLVHALLGMGSMDALLDHPVVGASFEGLVVEHLAAAAPSAACHFYRTAAGAEIDLWIAWPDGTSWAVEVKRSRAPKVTRGFHAACEDLRPTRRLLVHPGADRWPLPDGNEAIGLDALCREAADQDG